MILDLLSWRLFDTVYLVWVDNIFDCNARKFGYMCLYENTNCQNDAQKDDPKTWYSRLVYVTLCMLIHLFHLGNTPLQIILTKENILQIELPSKFWNDMYTQSGVTVMDWRVLMPLSVLSE